MTVRKPFIYALVLALALFLGLNTLQTVREIADQRALLGQVKTDDRRPGAGPKKSSARWSAAEWLERCEAEARQQQVQWRHYLWDEQKQSGVFHLAGEERQLLKYYAWFEQEAKVTAISEMKIVRGEQDAATLSIHFIW